MNHYRVTRPQAYGPGTPGHTMPHARQGHYTNAKDPIGAALAVRDREGFMDVIYDVQPWQGIERDAVRVKLDRPSGGSVVAISTEEWARGERAALKLADSSPFHAFMVELTEAERARLVNLAQAAQSAALRAMEYAGAATKMALDAQRAADRLAEAALAVAKGEVLPPD